MFGFAKPTNEVWGQFPLMLFFLKNSKKFSLRCVRRTHLKKEEETCNVSSLCENFGLKKRNISSKGARGTGCSPFKCQGNPSCTDSALSAAENLVPAAAFWISTSSTQNSSVSLRMQDIKKEVAICNFLSNRCYWLLKFKSMLRVKIICFCS